MSNYFKTVSYTLLKMDIRDLAIRIPKASHYMEAHPERSRRVSGVKKQADLLQNGFLHIADNAD